MLTFAGKQSSKNTKCEITVWSRNKPSCTQFTTAQHWQFMCCKNIANKLETYSRNYMFKYSTEVWMWTG